MMMHRTDDSLVSAMSQETSFARPPQTKGGSGTDTATLVSTELNSAGNNNNATASEPATSTTFAERWSNFILLLHRPTMVVLQTIAGVSARHPRSAIAVSTLVSLGLMAVGLSTNFYFNADTETLWTPSNSLALEHIHWVQHDSGFAPPPRYLALLFHRNDETNVLDSPHVIEHAFVALDTVRNHPAYSTACGEYGDFYLNTQTGEKDCWVMGPTRMWSNNATTFRERMNVPYDDANNDTQEQQQQEQQQLRLRQDVAQTYFPDGLPVPHTLMYGQLVRENSTYASYAQAFTVVIGLPEGYPDIKKVELEMVDDLLALQQAWLHDPDTDVVMEVAAHGSIPAELVRAVNADLPLIPVVFVMMSLFTSLVFAQRHKVFSRSGLGAAAVVAVLFSITAGFGLMFTIGVPFTSITQLIPFLMFGVGLDDAFIVVGSYIRTDPRKDPVLRIEETIHDVGLSITLTTLTTATAFGLGITSSVPAVYWLCQYCFPTIFFVLFYQLTFFVGCIVLDEQRIQARRRDLLVCIKVPLDEDAPQQPVAGHFVDRLMEGYAQILLLPIVRCGVIVSFLTLLGFATYSCMQLTQQFSVQDILPRESYVRDFLESQKVHFNDTGSFTGEVYFRYVDHSNQTMRQEMARYVQELQTLDFVSDVPTTSMWMQSFDLSLALFYPQLANEPFSTQVEAFLSSDINRNAFLKDFVLDDEGNIVASRIAIEMKADLDDVHDQIRVLQEERNLTFSIDVNQGREDDLAFFTLADIYTVFEFYVVCVNELISTTVFGIVSVSVVATFFIPHWSAVFFICPMICILYVDLLGVLQWGGLHINSLTYLGLTMSIGLLVDFIMHVLFRYYEVSGNRVEKTTKMLKTMGTSILLGGLTTFLGTIPLYFTSSNAFRVIFTTFVGIVTLGVGHGLILMPVLLATFGPESQVSMSYRRGEVKSPRSLESVGTGNAFGELEAHIQAFRAQVASGHLDQDKQLADVLAFVVQYARSTGVDYDGATRNSSCWGSPTEEAFTEEEEDTLNEQRESFGNAIASLFEFARQQGLNPDDALKEASMKTTEFQSPDDGLNSPDEYNSEDEWSC